MTMQNIEYVRENVIFKAFAENKTFDKALSALETYEKENPDKKIFANSDEKLGMRTSFHIFKKAEKRLSHEGKAPDFNNPEVVERMEQLVKSSLPAISREVIKSNTDSTSIKKANIGMMMEKHARNVATQGVRETSVNTELRHPTATVAKYGQIGRGRLWDTER